MSHENCILNDKNLNEKTLNDQGRHHRNKT